MLSRRQPVRLAGREVRVSLVAFDVETWKAWPGVVAPPLVCASIAVDGGDVALLDPNGARRVFREVVLTADRVAGQNISFDFLVMIEDAARRGEDWRAIMRRVFDLYDAGKVHDVMISQMLGMIAIGMLGKHPRNGGPLTDPVTGKEAGYRLSVVHYQLTGRVDAKIHDFWRKRYAILANVPQAEWPKEAREYPLDDVNNTLESAKIQMFGGGHGDVPGPLENQELLADQCRGAFALAVTAAHGLRTDPEAVEALEARALKAHADAVERFTEVGFFKPDGKENRAAIKRAVAKAYGATGVCGKCQGKGKVLNAKGEERVSTNPARIAAGKAPLTLLDSHWITCPAKAGGCDGTGLDIANARGVQRSDAGGIKADRDVKEESGDEELMALAELDGKLLGTYIPFLKKGTRAPITLWPNPVLDTLRASYNGVIQLLPRKGGVRECFVPREGWAFFSIDYSALELCTLAQTCLDLFGYSRLADTINSGKDPHALLGSTMLGISYDEMIDRVKVKKEKFATDVRQASKPGNFGFGGGMGAPKFVLAQRKANAGDTYGPDGTHYSGIRFCILLDGAPRCGAVKVTEWKDRPTPPLCKRCLEIVDGQLKPAWLATYPEMRDYFRKQGDDCEAYDGTLMIPGVGLKRGGLTFTSACNGPFQIRAAYGAKRALYRVVKETFLDESSDMYGSRVSIFVHDELFGETPLDDVAAELGVPSAWRAMPRMARVMVDEMSEVCPDVTIKAEPALALRWFKGMEPTFRDGRLVPWEPKK